MAPSPKLLALFFSLCAIAVSGAPADKLVAKVGSYPITQRDLADWTQTLLVDMPEVKADPKRALEALILALQNAQVLKNQKWALGDDVLEKEAKRIDESTLEAGKLSQIKAVFGADRKRYLKVFVLPTYANRVIYFDFFAFNPGIHSETKRAAREFLLEARNKPGEFEALARKRGFAASGFSVSKAQGLLPDRPRFPGVGPDPSASSPAVSVPGPVKDKIPQSSPGQVSEEGKRWMDEVVAVLKPGEVFDRVMEFQESWLVTKYEKPLGNDVHRFLGAIIPKVSFDDWVKRERKKVKVTRYH